MNERERILDLVKKGVLSTEEAIDILEGMAKAKDEKQINKAAAEVPADKNATSPFDDTENDDEMFTFDGEEKLRQNEAQDKENLRWLNRRKSRIGSKTKKYSQRPMVSNERENLSKIRYSRRLERASDRYYQSSK